MKQMYQFDIAGMTCHACESLIRMDLEDAGYTPKTITHEPGQLTIEADEDSVPEIKKNIEQSGTYTVAGVHSIPETL